MNNKLSEEMIREFIRLQTLLYESFIQQVDVKICKNDYISLAPELKMGSIFIDEDEWVYNKHGSGVYFERKSDGVVIDNDRKFNEPNQFSERRISEYLKSINGNKVEVNWHLVKIFLSTLLEQGKIKLTDNDYGLYKFI